MAVNLIKMEKLEQIKELLKKRRDLEKSNLEEKATEEDGYFDASDYSGGNFDDCFYLGKECGEAELIEELLLIIG